MKYPLIIETLSNLTIRQLIINFLDIIILMCNLHYTYTLIIKRFLLFEIRESCLSSQLLLKSVAEVKAIQ